MRPFLLLPILSFGLFAAEPVALHWLGDVGPGAPVGVTWGVPWPKGALRADTPMRLTAADGHRIDLQTRPLAYWPDGSVKWAGHAIPATPGIDAPLELAPGGANDGQAPSIGIKCEQSAVAFTIDTGAIRVQISKHPTQ